MIRGKPPPRSRLSGTGHARNARIGLHVGDVRRDRFQPPLESHLRRRRHVEAVLHEHASNRASRFRIRAPPHTPRSLFETDAAESVSRKIVRPSSVGRASVNFAIGLVIAVGSVIAGYAALGGHLGPRSHRSQNSGNRRGELDSNHQGQAARAFVVRRARHRQRHSVRILSRRRRTRSSHPGKRSSWPITTRNTN